MLSESKITIGVVGLGYVGLPLALEFGKIYPTVGYDLNAERINSLKKNRDDTLEIEYEDFDKSQFLTLSNLISDLESCNVYIVTVPTPVDKHNRPDLSPLINASEMLGKIINCGDIVIYESTVYPGATEEDCVPVIEKISGLTFNKDFFVGYSPERINPGDKEHRLINTVKVVSGSTPKVADFVNLIYSRVVSAGTFLVSSIKVAEASKVIENTQRDLNIALVNELAIIFEKMGIDTAEVLNAAGTKWNFLPFRPGLVGGHCIGVDPYYLTHKAQELGYLPEVILAGRRINDGMALYIVERVIRLMMRKRIHVVDSNILFLGASFKENCPDFRNSKVFDMIREFQELNANVEIYDPWVNQEEVKNEFGLSMCSVLIDKKYDAVIIAVGHIEFKEMGIHAIKKLGKEKCVIFDVKNLYSIKEVDGRL